MLQVVVQRILKREEGGVFMLLFSSVERDDTMQRPSHYHHLKDNASW